MDVKQQSNIHPKWVGLNNIYSNIFTDIHRIIVYDTEFDKKPEILYKSSPEMGSTLKQNSFFLKVNFNKFASVASVSKEL